jgi:hypothetical protein
MPHVSAPEGVPCEHCGLPVLVSDQGLVIDEDGSTGAVHRACFYGLLFSRHGMDPFPDVPPRAHLGRQPMSNGQRRALGQSASASGSG